jgi:2-oxoglutarate dehydrogenase E2 component (dihydrolipoamide succinyltransferase)
MTDITMPQLGETITEGTITKWFKTVGETVSEDEVLYEVSTDKVDSEVPSPCSGTVLEIRVPEGETVDVGVVLAVIGEAEMAAPSPAPPLLPEPVLSAPPPAPMAPPEVLGAAAASVLLSPVVRRLLTDNALDPATIVGTGIGGRITRDDVLAVVNSGGQPVAPVVSTPSPVAPPVVPAPAPEVVRRDGDRDEVIPHSNIRRRSAEHLRRSLDTSAHVYMATEVDFEAVDRVRRAHREEWNDAEGFSLTYLPFVSRAVVDAISEFPEVNATFTDEALIVHKYLNLGIAVDLDFMGLMVPVVRDAGSKRMRAIAREIRDLGARARSKKLTPDDISNGTFTITNPGPHGTLVTMPIINQPQVAILSTDGVKRRPVVVELPDGSESIAIHSVGNIVLSWDHRAFDGAYAASFLNQVRNLLETRDWAAEL